MVRSQIAVPQPSAWQCGGDDIGIGAVASGIRVESVWIVGHGRLMKGL